MRYLFSYAAGISFLLTISLSAFAADTYVDLNSPDDGPGTAWSNAFHTIQQGIDAASSGTVWVNDGVYEVGEQYVDGTLFKSRVYIDKNLTVKSVNGSEVTIIKGQGPLGDSAVRCVSIGDDGILSGFTLTDGCTMTNAGGNNMSAGGVYCFTTNAIVENCTITNCHSSMQAGAVYQGILNSCKIVNNTTPGTGIVMGGRLNNCTIARNSSYYASYGCDLNNCIVWDNTNSVGTLYNWFNSSFNYCCTLPAPTNGVGNITNDPQFVSSSDYNLAVGSPCMDSGSNALVQGTLDLAGNQRIYDGDRNGSSIVDMGCYEKIIKNTWYVDAASPHDGPGTSWNTAFLNIQSAISSAQDHDTVLVTNGIYATSGLTVVGSLGNRVAINKAIIVKSVNGPDVTTIKGFGGVDGDDARRCAYVGANAVLAGFTLREGHTRTSGIASDLAGGGAWCEDSGTISNCTITANTANNTGGGVYNGTVSRCIVSSNSADVGGGVYNTQLDNSLVVYNSAGSDGAGGYNGTFVNCTVSSNTATGDGGGVYNVDVKNSIVWGNTAGSGSSNWLSGSFYYTTTAPLPAGSGNVAINPYLTAAFNPLRTSCYDSGDNNAVIGRYDLVGEYRILQSGYGANATIVDMGCFEYFYAFSDSDGDLMSDDWERAHGLNYIDPSDATENPDDDGADNYAEYVAYTDPNDSNSYFCVSSFSNSSYATLNFNSTSRRRYTLQSCSNLLSASWSDVPGAVAIPGGGLSLSDTNQPPRGSYYRVKVEVP
jgi:hypothetical protein